MEKNIKQDIMNATIALIKEKGTNIEDITIREICSNANVAIGLVNYHFQSKEKLIGCCVQMIIGDVISSFEKMKKNQKPMKPVEKLRVMAKLTCDYLKANENISRISILTDLSNSSVIDNTSQTIAAYLPLVKDVCPPDMGHQEVMIKMNMLILSLQGFFLRSTAQNKDIALDFHNKEQRDKIVDKIIDTILDLEEE